MKIKVTRVSRSNKGATPSNCGFHKTGSTDK